MEDQNKLGVLLLSAARHQASFAKMFAAHPRARLVAVADERDTVDWVREQNQKLADDLGIPYLEDLDAALAREDVDLVSICPEYTRHGPLTIKALNAGK